MSLLLKLKTFLEILGGSRAPDERGEASAARRVLIAVWWLALFALVLAFTGRDVKFVYIDF